MVKDSTVHSVFEAMAPCLRAAIAQRDHSEEEEASLVAPVNLFECPSQWGRYHNNVKIYIETCLVHAVTGIPAQFLITNDHRFFKTFLWSTVAQDNVALGGYGQAGDSGGGAGEATRRGDSWIVSKIYSIIVVDYIAV